MGIEQFKTTAREIIANFDGYRDTSREELRLSLRALSLVSDTMAQHGKLIVHGWETPASDIPLTRFTDVRTWIKAPQEEKTPQELTHFILKFRFTRSAVSHEIDLAHIDSKNGIMNTHGEKATLSDLQQIVNCLEFVSADLAQEPIGPSDQAEY